MKFSPHGSPISLVFVGYVSSRILTDSLKAGVKQWRDGKTSHLLDLNVNISKTVKDTSKVTILANRKSHMHYRLTSSSITLDDLALL